MAEENWEVVSFVFSSETRSRVLRSLKSRKATPSQIADEVNQPLSHVSRALKELQDKELVVCLTPNRKKARLYAITPAGADILSRLETLRSPGEKK